MYRICLLNEPLSCMLCMVLTVNGPNILGHKTMFNLIIRLKVVDLLPSNAVCYYFYFNLSSCYYGFSNEHIASQSS